MRERLLVLGLIIGVCAVLAKVDNGLSRSAGKSDSYSPVETRYAVDGVCLGMTEGEVREIWGDLNVTEIDREKWLTRDSSLPYYGPYAVLCESGRVVSISGKVLTRGDHRVLGPDDYYHPVLVSGEDVPSRCRPRCGNRLFLERRLRWEDVVVEYGTWNFQDGDLKDVAPEYRTEIKQTMSRLVFVKLSDHNWYTNPPWRKPSKSE